MRVPVETVVDVVARSILGDGLTRRWESPRLPCSSLRFTPRGMRNSVILNLLVVAVGIVFFMGGLVAVAPRDPLGQGQWSQLGSK